MPTKIICTNYNTYMHLDSLGGILNIKIHILAYSKFSKHGQPIGSIVLEPESSEEELYRV